MKSPLAPPLQRGVGGICSDALVSARRYVNSIGSNLESSRPFDRLWSAKTPSVHRCRLLRTQLRVPWLTEFFGKHGGSMVRYHLRPPSYPVGNESPGKMLAGAFVCDLAPWCTSGAHESGPGGLRTVPPGSRRRAWSPERTAEVGQDSPDANGGPDADARTQGLAVLPDHPVCQHPHTPRPEGWADPDPGRLNPAQSEPNTLPRQEVCGTSIRKQEGGPRGQEFRMADDRGGAWSSSSRLSADPRQRVGVSCSGRNGHRGTGAATPHAPARETAALPRVSG